MALAVYLYIGHGRTLSVLSSSELSSHFEMRTCFQSFFNRALCKALPPFGVGTVPMYSWDGVVFEAPVLQRHGHVCN